MLAAFLCFIVITICLLLVFALTKMIINPDQDQVRMMKLGFLGLELLLAIVLFLFPMAGHPMVRIYLTHHVPLVSVVKSWKAKSFPKACWKPPATSIIPMFVWSSWLQCVGRKASSARTARASALPF